MYALKFFKSVKFGKDSFNSAIYHQLCIIKRKNPVDIFKCLNVGFFVLIYNQTEKFNSQTDEDVF